MFFSVFLLPSFPSSLPHPPYLYHSLPPSFLPSLPPSLPSFTASSLHPLCHPYIPSKEEASLVCLSDFSFPFSLYIFLQSFTLFELVINKAMQSMVVHCILLFLTCRPLQHASWLRRQTSHSRRSDRLYLLQSPPFTMAWPTEPPMVMECTDKKYQTVA